MFSFLRHASPEVSIEELDALRREGSVLVLDVREDWEFVRGHVPSATHVPLGQLDGRVAELPSDRRILVICASGHRSRSAAVFLLGRGFDGTASVRGGTDAWARAGGRLEQGPARAA